MRYNNKQKEQLNETKNGEVVMEEWFRQATILLEAKDKEVIESVKSNQAFLKEILKAHDSKNA